MRTLLSTLLLACAVSSFSQWSGNPTTNTPISVASSFQDLPQLVSDGNGGAIITWVDWRNPPLNSNGDIYAQRIGANGIVQWTIDGISVCSNGITQNRPQIISDGNGGAIIVWEDLRNNINANDIYAQRINVSGVAQWTANGIPVCTATSKQDRPQIVSDGAGGAIITWYDYRNNSVTPNIYAQWIDSSGTSLWTANGVSVCPATVNQIDPKIVSDGAGGAIVVWSDNRTNTQTDIYAKRITSSGVLKWSTSALGVCVVIRQQWAPSIAPDGSGGAIIAWADQRDTISVPRTDDVYVQRVDSNGNRLWAADGAAISIGTGNQMRPIVLPYGDGGAIISWEDERAGGSSRNVYAQRVNATGAVQWTANGVSIGIATGYKSFSQILPVGTGDGIIVWGDERSGSDNRNIFAQRINNNGTLTSVRFSEQLPSSFSLEQNYPNPFNPSTNIKFSLTPIPSPSGRGEKGVRVLLKVYDLLGREVATLVNENLEAGSYETTFDANGLASGVYLYTLTSGQHTSTRKLLLMR